VPKKPTNKTPKDEWPAAERQTNSKPVNEKPAKRIARRIKPARAGQRYQIGVIVTGTTKNIIAKEAMKTGRTISREVEILIERALAYDKVLESRQITLEEMEKGNIEAALWRLGYTPIRTPIDGKAWKVWAEPGHPRAERSGFIS
jgi:hypothetical protein